VARNCYLILGVDSDATQDQIRSAYRRKAKQSHPDYHQGGSKPFRDVQEAYETLSDPERRRAHDDELARVARPHPPLQRTRAEPLRSRRCPVEPLIPTAESRASEGTRWDWFSYPPLTDPFDRPWNDLGNLIWPRSGRSEELQVTVPLTRQQALRGGRVRVSIPVRSRCPDCRGRGSVGFYRCWRCAGTGHVSEELPVSLSFPAGISGGTVSRVPLDRFGLRDVCLVVRFRLAGR
jgi:molecular chaperone DnaJ